MANIALQRVQREFKEVTTCEEAQLTGVKVEMNGDNLMRLRGEIRGPPDTPYSGGVYKLDIEIPENYPFHPPKIKFLTRIWHPNISSVTGAICLDVLKDQWAASMTLRTVLLSIQALLCSPEPNDPQDAVVARQSIENPSLFNQTAQVWAQAYAGANGALNGDFQKKLDQMMDMGVSKEKAITALSHCSWDVAKAIEREFS